MAGVLTVDSGITSTISGKTPRRRRLALIVAAAFSVAFLAFGLGRRLWGEAGSVDTTAPDAAASAPAAPAEVAPAPSPASAPPAPSDAEVAPPVASSAPVPHAPVPLRPLPRPTKNATPRSTVDPLFGVPVSGKR
jgi:hypothetical protein